MPLVGRQTICGLLASRAEFLPERPYVRFREGGVETAVLSYAHAWSYATRWAALFRDRGLRRGEPVLLALPNSVEFVGAFFGALLAGGLPATVAPIRRGVTEDPHLSTILSRLRFLEARALVLPDEQIRGAELRGAGLPEDVLALSSRGLPSQPEDLSPCDREIDLALLQFTSGTSGSAKAVELTHTALIAQLDAVSRALAMDGSLDSGLSWLPFSHDMGLIGFLMVPAFAGCQVTILQAEEFIARPASWIRALSDTGATITGGPPSAYLLCARRIREAEARRYDLGRLRVGLVGAELVSRRSLRLFEERFAASGLGPTVLTPTYGLAENSLAVTMAPPDRGPEAETVGLHSLQEKGIAVPPWSDDEPYREIVSVGRPLPNTEVVIVDDDGNSLEDRQLGEIAVCSASLMNGYRRDPRGTRKVLGNGRLLTGDLGYRVGGRLFITGRKKEVLVVGGRNFYPEDLEEAAATVSGVDRGRVVAVSYDDPNLATDEVVLILETGLRDDGERRILRRAVRGALIRAHFPVSQVVLVPPKTFRTTPSGKLKRLDALRRFLDGEFKTTGRPPALAAPG